MKDESLVVIANQRKMGEVTFQANRLGFQYAPEWQYWDQAFPLSVSMPLTQREHRHVIVEAFLWGLLPDNQRLLDEWGRRFHVSAGNAFRLLQHVGEDCAGAIQFVLPEREADLVDQKYREEVEWISEDELAERLLMVLKNHGAQRTAQDRGHFSLAGAQPKIALYQSPADGVWGVPYGMTPTTHILKPAASGFNGMAENEHFCLTLANHIGLRTAQSRVILANRRPTIVVKRYDRLQKSGICLRIHQEDMCQALGVHPYRKYQSDGGPGVKQIASLIRDVSEDANSDIKLFAKSLIFNFLISGTDAHAKNYSLIMAPQSRIRLAPLYDITSSLPCPKLIPPYKAEMAMKIGGENKIQKIQKRHWEGCAKELGIRWSAFKSIFDSLADDTITHVPVVRDKMWASGLEEVVLTTLYRDVVARCNACRSLLASDS